jgi:hypothetical protein
MRRGAPSDEERIMIASFSLRAFSDAVAELGSEGGAKVDLCKENGWPKALVQANLSNELMPSRMWLAAQAKCKISEARKRKTA